VNSNQKAGAGPLHTRVVAIDDEAFVANGDLTMPPPTLGRDVVWPGHGDVMRAAASKVEEGIPIEQRKHPRWA
jgi:hypothetical protein